MKTCLDCGILKDAQDFTSDKTKRDGLASYCRTCAAARCRTWRQNNVEKTREHRRAFVARTPGQSTVSASFKSRYAKLLEAQDGVCAICGNAEPNGNRLSVDHDHGCCEGSRSCGECVRGLLCSSCNTRTALFEAGCNVNAYEAEIGYYLASYDAKRLAVAA